MCCMLWKQLEDESTVISLSCDSLLERATQLDQSFCAFSVPLIHFKVAILCSISSSFFYFGFLLVEVNIFFCSETFFFQTIHPV